MFWHFKSLDGQLTLCYGLHVPHTLCVEWVCSRICHWEIPTESGLRYKDKSVTPSIIKIYMLQKRALTSSWEPGDTNEKK